MIKSAIIYASRHHGSTRKLVEAIAEGLDITIIDAESCQQAELGEYDFIGFASGIDFGRFYDSVITFLQNNLPEKKKVFFLYTCAKTSSRFTVSICKEAQRKNAIFLGEYGCRGFNTYGPWKLLGGMNKGHPNEAEISEARCFIESLLLRNS